MLNTNGQMRGRAGPQLRPRGEARRRMPGLNLGKHNVGNAVDMLAERALAE